jgi:hypothetical protein
MRALIRTYTLFNILSLDVVSGACFTAVALCIFYTIPFLLTDVLLLGNAIWIVYTLDHLYDAARSHGKTSSRRRNFHIRYRPLLLIVLCIALIAEAALLFFCGRHLLKAALPAFGITFFYLLLNWLSQHKTKKFYIKELMISAGFVCGILTIPSSYLPALPEIFHLYLYAGAFLFLTALANVLLIARYETEADRREQQPSITGWIGQRMLKRVIACVLLLQCATAFYFIPVIGFAMFAGMAVLFAFPEYFRFHERYRMVADGIFLLPALFLLYHLIS